MLKYQMPLLAVRDIEVSKRFYRELLGQTVVQEQGGRAAFSGGFALQQDFDKLIDLPKSTILHQSNNFELYFETEDFDAFSRKLSACLDVELLHLPRVNPYQRRIVRLYDPDWHIVAVGETACQAARRLLREGRSMEEVSELMQLPLTLIRQYGEDAES